MDRRVVQLILMQLGYFLYCSGSRVRGEEAIIRQRQEMTISTTKRDITTPIPTVPTTNPSSGVWNPAISDPDSSAATTTTFGARSGSGSGPGSWCVASQSGAQIALQVALDYACGAGGADCGAIQESGGCYIPNNVRAHASYAFNSYYQKTPLPNSCNFAGTAVITNTDPSHGTCQYPTTSTSSTILNITNSSGSRVFGAGGPPINPTTAQAPLLLPNAAFFLLFFTLFLTTTNIFL